MKMHCQMLQTGEIQTVIGDASRNGIGGPQYCGLWSLASKHRQFNAFGNSFAGLLPGEIRGQAPVLECVDESTCALARKADAKRPVDSRAVYRVVAPYYVDHSLTFTDRADVRLKGCDFREVSWCCYTNCPDDPHLNFLSGGRWFKYISPKHGIGSNIAPSYLTDDQLEVWPGRTLQAYGMEPFHWDRIKERFDQPFYYGRLGPMALILIFDQPRWLRFYCSPTGGGNSLIPGKSCPAWDFEWVIPAAQYAVNREYTLRVRLVYKLFVSEDDVLHEFRRAQDELAFERV